MLRTHLNPKRGDLPPSAGTLFGEIEMEKLATGYLLKPNDGFQSPLIFIMFHTEQ